MSRKTALRNILFYILYILVLSPVVSLITYNITGSEDSAFIAVVCCAALTLSVMLFSSKKYISMCFKNFKVHYLIYPIVGYISYYFIVTILTAVINLTSSNGIPISENQANIQSMIDQYNLVLLFIMLVIIAPIMEELVFRAGIIYAVQGNNKKRKKYLIVLSYFLSITLFSMLHVMTEITGDIVLKEIILISMPYIVLSGVLLYNFTKTKYNVLTSTLCHMLNNFIAYVVLIYFLI